MSNENIKIDFPKEMRVTSPEIDSINNTAQRISNWLHQDFKEIIKPLQVLPKIPEILSDFKTKVVEQFSMLFTNLIVAQTVNRQANIKVGKRKVDLIEEHLAKKKNQFAEARKTIVARFKNLTKRIVDQHDNYLKQLDNHVYEIPEKIYPNLIQEKISKASIPTQNFIVTHAEESALYRYNCLNSGYNKAEQSINNFLNQRSKFYEKLAEFPDTKINSGNYGLPYWILEIEDKESGKKRLEIFFEWELENKEVNIDKANVEKFRSFVPIHAKNKLDSTKLKRIEANIINQLQDLSEIHQSELDRFNKECKFINIEAN